MRDRLIEMLQEIHACDGSLFDSNVCDSEVVEMLEEFADHLGINPSEYQLDDEDNQLDDVSLHRYVAQADKLTACLKQLKDWRYGEGGDNDA